MTTFRELALWHTLIALRWLDGYYKIQGYDPIIEAWIHYDMAIKCRAIAEYKNESA